LRSSWLVTRTKSVGQDTRTFFTETSVVAHVLCSVSAVAHRARTGGRLGTPPV